VKPRLDRFLNPVKLRFSDLFNKFFAAGSAFKKFNVRLAGQELVNQFLASHQTSRMLGSFSKIVIETPADKIVGQIKDLIRNGELRVGQRLPSERALAEQLNVGRGYVRDALRKLEFYGVLRKSPQSGTYVQGVGVQALEGLIGDVLGFEGHEFKDLVKTRLLIECQTAGLAAELRTKSDVIDLQQAFESHQKKVLAGDSAVKDDLLFHVRITEAAKNTVLQTVLRVIAPDVIERYREHQICEGDDRLKALDEHRDILEAIVDQDPARAEAAMANHLEGVLRFSTMK